MADFQQLLLAAVQRAPRRYRLPPLPPDATAAAAAGSDAALAFALAAVDSGTAAGDLQVLFTSALAQLLQAAVAPGADPAFQALVARTEDPGVAEYVALLEPGVAGRGAVRSSVDAVAHPGKLRGMPAGSARDALLRLHELAQDEDWHGLADQAGRMQADAQTGEELRAALAAIRMHPALPTLLRIAALRAQPAVQRYEGLARQRGPLAGSEAAAAQGRARAQRGARAEAGTVQAFAAVCALLDACKPGPAHRVVHGLRSPAGSAAHASKQEWDAAILRGAGTAGHPTDLLLLAEVKAAPAAAVADLPRLLRGLRLVGRADACAFQSEDGPVHIAPDSLRALQPAGEALPPHVIYCCDADPQASPPLLAASAKALLLAQAASLAFAARLLRGEAPDPGELAPVWDALPAAPHLRSALQQYRTGQAVCAAMLQPGDLLAAVAALARRP